MLKIKIALLFLFIQLTITCPVYADTVVMHEDFSRQNTIDSSKWTFLNGSRGGGYYDIPENVYLKNGVLNVTARKQNFVDAKGQSYAYTSGWIWSHFRFRYGTIAIKAKIDTGDGVFPALWLSGDDAFPGGKCAEIDMLESVGVPTSFYSTCWDWRDGKPMTSEAYTVGSGPWSHGIVVPWTVNVSDWNTYELSWQPGQAVFAVNGKSYGCVRQPWIASVPMRVIMSMQAGARRTTSNSPAFAAMQIKEITIWSGPNAFYATYPHTP